MRKNYFIIAAVAALVCSCGAPKNMATNNQNNNGLKSLSGTEAKVKEWESKGFSVSGAYGTLTMYDLLEMHNKKIIENQGDIIPIFGTGVGPDKTTARYVALNNAATTYATAAKSVVAGAMATSFSNFQEEGMKLMGAYTQKVRDFIMSGLKESVAVYRVVTENTKDKGKYEYEIYYILDENFASQARKNAMNAALKETATEQVFGTKVDEFVEEMVGTDVE